MVVESKSWSQVLPHCFAHWESGVCCTGGSRLRLRIKQGFTDGLPGAVSAADNPWYSSSEEAEAKRLREAAAAMITIDGEPSWEGIRWSTAHILLPLLSMHAPASDILRWNVA